MAKLTDESLMPYGIHNDKAMANVPASYLLWLWDQGKGSREVTNYIFENLTVLKKEVGRHD